MQRNPWARPVASSKPLGYSLRHSMRRHSPLPIALLLLLLAIGPGVSLADDEIDILTISRTFGAAADPPATLQHRPVATPPAVTTAAWQRSGERTTAETQAFLAPPAMPAQAGQASPANAPQAASPPAVPTSFVDELLPSQQFDVNEGPQIEIEEAESGKWWDSLNYDLTVYGRGYYRSDRRLWFIGTESVFGVEGGLYGYLEAPKPHWTYRVDTELYLNQPFDRNVLVDTPTRASFAHNFDVDVLEISQLALSGRRGDLLISLGKMVTPFGRFYFPLFSNAMDDAPFIRSEAIRWRETGILLQYDPSILVGTVAMTNGGLERDANSSKAIVARVGLEEENWAIGTSVKWQDGIGSETQKERNNHFGMDAMVKRGPWILSGEVIYDQYGLRKGDIALDDIFWGRSLYNRQLRNPNGGPLEGIGYYVDLGYVAESWRLHLNYGEYYPEQIGDRIHDEVSRRGIVKFAYHLNENFSWYSMLMLENSVQHAFDQTHPREGFYLLLGFQATL